MQAFYYNKVAETDKSVPLVTYSLVDAFENRQLSACTDASNSGAANVCTISNDESPIGVGGCVACRALVKERMSK